MSDFPVTDKNKIKRLPKRGYYDKETIYQILDGEVICHISFSESDQPYIIPIAYVRIGDSIYIHGAKANRMMNNLGKGINACISVTRLDAYVLSRSSFHHSMNYHSVVLFGKGEIIEEKDEKMKVLKAFSDHLIPGRWEDARPPNEKELSATMILKFIIDEASAKIRTGPPSDDKQDYNLDVWAGLLRLKSQITDIIPDEELKENVKLPDYLEKFIDNYNSKINK